jgi:hypothetical protein
MIYSRHYWDKPFPLEIHGSSPPWQQRFIGPLHPDFVNTTSILQASLLLFDTAAVIDRVSIRAVFHLLGTAHPLLQAYAGSVDLSP